MPINFLANRHRAQRLGRVRLGIKAFKCKECGEKVPATGEHLIDCPHCGAQDRATKRKTYPSATPYFVLGHAPALKEIYREQPTQLNIEFLWDDIHMTFPHYMRRYSARGLRCLGDGTAILYRVSEKGDVDVRDGNLTDPGGKVLMDDDNQPIKVACLGEQCPHYVDGGCKPTGFLRFLPVEAPRLGYYDMVCHQRAIVGIKTQLELAHGIFQHITGIPFVLHRGEVEYVAVKIPGKGMVDMPIRTQWIEIEPTWFAENFRLRDKHRVLAQAKVRQDVIDLFQEDETSDELALAPTKIGEFKRPLFDGETGEILDADAVVLEALVAATDAEVLSEPGGAEQEDDDPTTPPTAKVKRPADPETVRGWLQDKAAEKGEKAGAKKPSSKQLGLMVGVLEKLLGGDDADKKRRSVLYYGFNVESAGDMFAAEVSAVLDWLDLEKDEATGEYIPAAIPVQECRAMHRQALLDEGQLELELGSE